MCIENNLFYLMDGGGWDLDQHQKLIGTNAPKYYIMEEQFNGPEENINEMRQYLKDIFDALLQMVRLSVIVSNTLSRIKTLSRFKPRSRFKTKHFKQV